MGLTMATDLTTLDAALVERDRVLRILREHEAEIRARGVTRLRMFGSMARGEAAPESDVDLMVEFLPDSRASLFDIATLKEELSAALGGRRVDIATPEILRNPFRRKSIVPDLKPIYVA